MAASGPGRAETGKAARAGQAEPPRVTLCRHVQAAAAAARSEPEFFTALARRVVQVRLRHSDHDPAEVTGYAVGLPGLVHRDGQPVWYGGHTLDQRLALGALRRRWQVGQRGAPPGPAAFTGADAADIFGYAAAVAAEAARQLRAAPGPAQAADVA